MNVFLHELFPLLHFNYKVQGLDVFFFETQIALSASLPLASVVFIPLFFVQHYQIQFIYGAYQVEVHIFLLFQFERKLHLSLAVIEQVSKRLCVFKLDVLGSFIDYCQSKFAVIKSMHQEIEIVIFGWLVNEGVVRV